MERKYTVERQTTKRHGLLFYAANTKERDKHALNFENVAHDTDEIVNHNDFLSPNC